MILLDTHAAIWVARRHRRAAPLDQFSRWYLSPATILEIQVLLEAGRLRGAAGFQPATYLATHPRLTIDDPPAAKWFVSACDLGWTRDPFDRLIAAHARVRGWKLATADDLLLDHLAPSEVLAL